MLAITNMEQSYKARKEAFVSNLSGSTLQDINVVSFVAPVRVTLHTLLEIALPDSFASPDSRHPFYSGPPSSRDCPSLRPTDRPHS